MKGDLEILTFGPVPSRRLGRSLGINNIPPKACSYSCVYCQVGPTHQPEILPRQFYEPDEIERQVRGHLARLPADEPVDYLTFVPDGEPTLDARLGESIERLRPLGIPIAIISNASLIWHEEVRAILALADWVSLKVDAIDDNLWRRINRPHPALNHSDILNGILSFSADFQGTLATESMQVRDINDSEAAASQLADWLGQLAPDVAYLSVPTRPPSESFVAIPDEATLNRCYQLVSQQVTRVELLTGYEGNAFASTGDAEQDLLSITAVHPMREEAVRALLARTGNDWTLIERLIKDGQLVASQYQGQAYYLRRMVAR